MSILSSKAVLASISIKTWNMSRVDQEITAEVKKRHNAEGDVGRYTKHLIDKRHMAQVTNAGQGARNVFYKFTKPWSDDGQRILPNALFEKYANEMREAEDRFNKAVRDFIAGYPQYVKEAKRNLNGMFNTNDYPEQAALESMFKLDKKIMPIADADAFSKDFRITAGKEQIKDIQSDVEARLKEAMQQATVDSMRQIAEVVGHMAERLSGYKPSTTNKKGKVIASEGRFHDSLVENVRELAELLPAFNLNGDKKLSDITNKIMRDLTKHNADTLREDNEVRKDVAKKAKAIFDQVSEFMA